MCGGQLLTFFTTIIMVVKTRKEEHMCSLTVDEKQWIKSSYNLLIDKEVDLGKQFFLTLFEMAPLVKPMFKRDIDIVQVHFNEIIATAVHKIDKFDEIKPALFELGKKHADFGAQKEHFKVVKAALILTLESELRGYSNEQVRLAWENYYDNISQVMIEGLESQR